MFQKWHIVLFDYFLPFIIDLFPLEMFIYLLRFNTMLRNIVFQTIYEEPVSAYLKYFTYRNAITFASVLPTLIEHHTILRSTIMI